MQPVSLRNQDLGTNEIDARHHFRDGMLYLDAWIHFDEIPLPRVDVVKELHCPGIAVIRLACKLHRRVAKFASNTGRKIRSGSDLDHLLMPSLHRTVTLVQVQQVAVMVGKNLNFQVPRPRQVPFQEDGCIAESRLRFALCFFEKSIELRGITDNAHSPATAAHRSFHDDGIADLLRNFVCFARGFHWLLGSRQNGNSCRSGQPSRSSFVA